MFGNLIEMSLFQITGLIGVAFYLGSYAALQFEILISSGVAYSVCNFLASSCVLISLFESFNLSSAIIQISWIAISIFGIMRLLSKQRETEEFINTERPAG